MRIQVKEQETLNHKRRELLQNLESENAQLRVRPNALLALLADRLTQTDFIPSHLAPTVM